MKWSHGFILGTEGAISIFLNFSGQTIRETVLEQHAVAWPPSGDTPINGLVVWSGLYFEIAPPAK